MSYVVAALYKFVALDDADALRRPLLEALRVNDVRGTILLAGEGINGTIAGSREGIDAVRAWLDADARFHGIRWKESIASTKPFHRTRVKRKREIVTMGVDGIDPARLTGTAVGPAEWNRLISDPDTVVIDTRNRYEVGIGSFRGAINPQTDSFREFPDYIREHLADHRQTRLALFCTGGIRCEKATAYLREQGFKNVFQLEGGILEYLDNTPEGESLWEGECFVFDRRVAVGHALDEGSYEMCHACRHPVSEADKASDGYVEGVSCPNCFGNTSEEQRERFAERQRQVELAQARGEEHIGTAGSRTQADRQ